MYLPTLRHTRIRTAALVVLVLFPISYAEGQPSLSLPIGFSISKYGTIPVARSMAISGDSQPGKQTIVYVGSATANKTTALLDRNGDGSVDDTVVVLDKLDTPNGVAWKDGVLYVSGFDKGKGMIWKVEGIDAYVLKGEAVPAEQLLAVSDELPGDTWHGRRVLRFGPDGLLYFGIGAPCNVCQLRTSGSFQFGTIYKMNVTTGQATLVVTGVRNSVGFDWHPATKQLYFTDNGRDNMGGPQLSENQPDCELNRVDNFGQDFGFPYCQSGGFGPPEMREAGRAEPLEDPDFNPGGSVLDCEKTTVALQPLGPHVAPLGMRFYDPAKGSMFPSRYANAIFIAEHGSWNRNVKLGYRVTMVRLDSTTGAPVEYGNFASGWLEGQNVTGRPVDVQQLPDGSLLISDDAPSGVVWRVTYQEPSSTPSWGSPPPPAPPPAPNATGRPAQQLSGRILMPLLTFCLLAALLL